MRASWRRGSVVVVAALVLSACSGSETSTSSPTDDGGPADGVVTLTMTGFAFEPSTVSLPEGDSLTVRNEDTATHTFTMDDGSIDESLEPGDQVVVTPTSAGAFHCEIHPSMTGTLALA